MGKAFQISPVKKLEMNGNQERNYDWVQLGLFSHSSHETRTNKDEDLRH